MGKRLLAMVFAAALILAACGDDDDADDDAAATGDTAAQEASDADAGGAEAAEADLQLSDSALGRILVDASGNTLYLFVPDAQGASTCYDECEAAWPIVGELSSVGDGLDAGLLGTTERTDGVMQATYNGWPLYYFVGDVTAGDATGQGADGVWYVLDAGGDAIGAG